MHSHSSNCVQPLHDVHCWKICIDTVQLHLANRVHTMHLVCSHVLCIHAMHQHNQRSVLHVPCRDIQHRQFDLARCLSR
jgi:hypothetical protein